MFGLVPAILWIVSYCALPTITIVVTAVLLGYFFLLVLTEKREAKLPPLEYVVMHRGNDPSKVMFFLHGWPGTRHDFDAQAESFGKKLGYTCVGFELPPNEVTKAAGGIRKLGYSVGEVAVMGLLAVEKCLQELKSPCANGRELRVPQPREIVTAPSDVADPSTLKRHGSLVLVGHDYGAPISGIMVRGAPGLFDQHILFDVYFDKKLAADTWKGSLAKLLSQFGFGLFYQYTIIFSWFLSVTISPADLGGHFGRCLLRMLLFRKSTQHTRPGADLTPESRWTETAPLYFHDHKDALLSVLGLQPPLGNVVASLLQMALAPEGPRPGPCLTDAEYFRGDASRLDGRRAFTPTPVLYMYAADKGFNFHIKDNLRDLLSARNVGGKNRVVALLESGVSEANAAEELDALPLNGESRLGHWFFWVKPASTNEAMERWLGQF